MNSNDVLCIDIILSDYIEPLLLFSLRGLCGRSRYLIFGKGDLGGHLI